MGDKVAVVTGAGRGLGKGIARALAAAGLTVYATGRSAESLDPVLADISAAGGQGRAIVCDHADDVQVAQALGQVAAEAGRLDILVNNAAAVYPELLTGSQPFWNKDIKLVDMIDVGLRSNYVATWHAAQLLLATPGSLVVQISFYGAVSYFHGPAYGAAKAGTDKMAHDMGHDFSGTGVTCVAFWPGFILSDALLAVPQDFLPEDLRSTLPKWETPEFSGRVIERLWRDPEVARFNGQTVIGAELGRRYGIADSQGRIPPDFRSQLGSPDSRFMVPAADLPL